MKMDEGHKPESLEALMNTWNEDERKIAIQNRFPYLFEKARMLLELGPDKYRLVDYFDEPNEDLSISEIELIMTGCQQILEGRGLFERKPFVDLDVRGFRILMETFHFETLSRRTKHSHHYNAKDGALDVITFKHIMDQTEVTYMNFVEYPDMGDNS